eukprot:s793_g17.t1
MPRVSEWLGAHCTADGALEAFGSSGSLGVQQSHYASIGSGPQHFRVLLTWSMAKGFTASCSFIPGSTKKTCGWSQSVIVTSPLKTLQHSLKWKLFILGTKVLRNPSVTPELLHMPFPICTLPGVGMLSFKWIMVSRSLARGKYLQLEWSACVPMVRFNFQKVQSSLVSNQHMS